MKSRASQSSLCAFANAVLAVQGQVEKAKARNTLIIIELQGDPKRRVMWSFRHDTAESAECL